MQIIQKERIPREVDKITLVVDGIKGRRDALPFFKREYSAKALRERRRRLKLPNVTLELVKDNDFWAVNMRCWWDEESNRPLIELIGRKGKRVTTLSRALRRLAQWSYIQDRNRKISEEIDMAERRG